MVPVLDIRATAFGPFPGFTTIELTTETGLELLVEATPDAVADPVGCVTGAGAAGYMRLNKTTEQAYDIHSQVDDPQE